jgi:hypothetical protein
MRYLTDFKFFESRDSDVSEIINDITPIVNDILLELNFKNIEGESRFVKVGNRKGDNSHYIIIKLKKERIKNNEILTWNEVSDVMKIASDYLKDNNFIYSVEKTNHWGNGVDVDSNPRSQYVYNLAIHRMEIYFKYKD